MKKKIVLASNNKHKIKEIKKICGDDIELLTLNDIGFVDEIEETGNTFKENALIKAQAVSCYLKKNKMNYQVMSDDSGLCCTGLNNEPGIYSARYAGSHGDDQANRIKVLEKIKNKDRTAYYVCAVVLLNIDGSYMYEEGKTYGKIIDEEKGNNGFGYDSIFFSDDLQKTFGEASDKEKNTVSHRTRALQSIKKYL